jgi:hypothetical protein
MRQELRNAFGKVFITIIVDRENRWVHTNWAYTDAVREAGFSCVLNDTSQVVGGRDHSLEWVANEWAPQAARAGITHFALVTTPQTFAASTAVSFLSSTSAFQVRVFESALYAKAWLRQYSLTTAL